MAVGRPERQISQVRQVSDTPGPPRSNAIELRGQAPGSTVSELFRQPQPIRGDDEGRAGLVVVGSQIHPVVADRQIGRQHEAGFADPATVQLERRSEVVDLRHLATQRAILELQPDVGRSAVSDMRPKTRLRASARDDGRRQRARPIRPQVLGQGGVALLFGVRPNAEGSQHGHQSVLRDGYALAAPVLELGGDAVPAGEFDQRGRKLRHVAHLASNPEDASRAGRP